MSGGVRGRRFALHHLWKKIPRRRAQLRGAKARTARYMRWLFSQKKDSIPLLLKYFGSLTTRWRADPPRTLCGKSTPRGRTLCGRLLLPFGGFGFRTLRSSPFPPRLSSFVETLIPSVGTGSDGGPRPLVLSPPYLPSRAPGKVRPRASFPIPDFPNPQGGGPNTESSSPSLASPGQKAELSETTSNKRQCVRPEDFLLVRRRGYCSGPRPR